MGDKSILTTSSRKEKKTPQNKPRTTLTPIYSRKTSMAPTTTPETSRDLLSDIVLPAVTSTEVISSTGLQTDPLDSSTEATLITTSKKIIQQARGMFLNDFKALSTNEENQQEIETSEIFIEMADNGLPKNDIGKNNILTTTKISEDFTTTDKSPIFAKKSPECGSVYEQFLISDMANVLCVNEGKTCFVVCPTEYKVNIPFMHCIQDEKTGWNWTFNGNQVDTLEGKYIEFNT